MIDFKLLQHNKNRFRFQLIVSYVVFTLLLIVLITVIHIYISEKQEDEMFEQNVKLDAIQRINYLYQYLEQKESSVKAIALSPFVSAAINVAHYEPLKHYFMDMAEVNSDYMQIRYIDAQGEEVVRVDREKKKTAPFVVNPLILQNKQERPYFSETKRLAPFNVWYSPLELNEEYGRLDEPIKPVLRISIPMFNQNGFSGIFIVNLFVEEFMAQLFTGQEYDNYLVDHEGYYLIHDDPTKQWSKYFSKAQLHDDFKEHANAILEASSPHYFNDIHVFAVPVYIGNFKYHMIFMQKKSLEDQKKQNETQMIFLILGIIILGAFLFAYFLSKPFDAANTILFTEAKKLYQATLSLEERVKDEVDKNERQQRILQHQSKLSALGELLSAITHQWRHPITRISLLLQNLKYDLEPLCMTNSKIEKTINASLNQIDFLSETIENFRNFYMPETTQETFHLKEALESVLLIINDILEHNGITVIARIDKTLSLYGNKAMFAHVFLNLINNAKDELINRKIKNPVIYMCAKSKNDSFTLFMLDNAGGVDSVLLKRLFEPYVSTKGKDGSGIGLYITKAIIEDKHHGSIKARNFHNGLLFVIKIKNIYENNPH